MIKCVECGKNFHRNLQIFEECDWCKSCIDAENERSIKESGGMFRIRPPRYMLKPEEYKKFGY